VTPRGGSKAEAGAGSGDPAYIVTAGRVPSRGGGAGRAGGRRSGAFTLAEVLAALVFMAIVIPVALQGLSIASRAGAVAGRKREAARVAERVLAESLLLTNQLQSASSGVVTELDRDYRWSLRSERWAVDSAMQLLTVEVSYPVQGKNYSVQLSTLVESQ